jgi:hypothetical protein
MQDKFIYCVSRNVAIRKFFLSCAAAAGWRAESCLDADRLANRFDFFPALWLDGLNSMSGVSSESHAIRSGGEAVDLGRLLETAQVAQTWKNARLQRVGAAVEILQTGELRVSFAFGAYAPIVITREFFDEIVETYQSLKPTFES